VVADSHVCYTHSSTWPGFQIIKDPLLNSNHVSFMRHKTDIKPIHNSDGVCSSINGSPVPTIHAGTGLGAHGNSKTSVSSSHEADREARKTD
jgi:hypothetical protein